MQSVGLKKYILFLLISFIAIQQSKAESKDQQIKVALRSIGHEFLLQMDDITSRVLPIEKVNGRYKVAFENEFAFEPYMLSFATFKVIENNEIKENFIVEVET